jgi:hypothetical protein
MPTRRIRTRARSVPRINEVDRHTTQLSFVTDKRPQLRESPRVECCALRPSSLHPRANVRQVVGRNRPLRAFGLRNNPFGENMVDVFGKPALLTGKLFQTAMAALRAFLLELTTQPAMAIAHVLDRLAAVDLPIAISCNVRDTQVNTERAINLDRFGCFNGARSKQVPGAADEGEISFATLVFEQLALVLTTHKRDGLSPIQCPDRNKRVGKREREDAIIVGNCAKWSKPAQRLPIQLVAIRDFGNTAHGELRGQVKRLTRRLIGQFVDGKLPKGCALPGHLADVVAGGVGRLKRAFERSGLFRRGQQFQLDGEFHLAALLLLNVVLDRFRRDVSGAANIVRTAPQRWQARTQMWELIAQDAGGVAFELIGELLRRVDRQAIYKQVQVIGQHFKRLNSAVQFGCLLVQQFLQPLRNHTRQHLATVLRTPDEVVIDGREAASNVAIPFSTHVLQYSTLFDKRQRTNNVGGRASSASLKGVVSARTFL